MADHTSPHAELERALTRLVRRAFLPTTGERTRREAGVGLERAAYVTLVRISDLDAPRLSDLAAALGLEPSTVSRHVKCLVTDGYVEVAADPDDARARRYLPTTNGREVLARVRAARHARLEELLSDWDPADIGRLAADLDRLVDAFEAEDPA